MLPNDTNDYPALWENVELYLLAPIAPEVDISKFYGESKYMVYRRSLLGVVQFLIPKELASEVMKRMIDAGVEVSDEIPDNAEYARIERLWTDRKEEFVLIRKDWHPTKKNSGFPYSYARILSYLGRCGL